MQVAPRGEVLWLKIDGQCRRARGRAQYGTGQMAETFERSPLVVLAEPESELDDPCGQLDDRHGTSNISRDGKSKDSKTRYMRMTTVTQGYKYSQQHGDYVRYGKQATRPSDIETEMLSYVRRALRIA